MQDPKNFSTIDTIRLIDTKGPWESKSGGKLSVLMALDAKDMAEFLNFSSTAFDDIQAETGVNIRGIRIYNVSDIAKGSVGANEFHMARTEIVSVLSGAALWRCEDIFGNVKEFTLDATQSLVVPYGILHTYTALEDNTRLQVLCNTLFEPEIAGTHDSFLLEEFKKLQVQLG